MTIQTTSVAELLAAGAHYAYPKARRHPTTKRYIFGAKGGVEIFDLEKTAESLAKAVEVVSSVAATGKKVLFVGGKREAQKPVRNFAAMVGAPYVAGRWVGGTLSNFDIIKKRIEKLISLIGEREQGTLTKYTKKERLLIDREIKRLEDMFGGIKELNQLPSLLVIIDPKHEKNALAEARMLRIPVVALANSDCDISAVTYPIPASDANVATITYILEQLTKAYASGAERAPKKTIATDRRVHAQGDGPRGRRLPRQPRSNSRS
jgi:small subunit ribosomal protein S2